MFFVVRFVNDFATALFLSSGQTKIFRSPISLESDPKTVTTSIASMGIPLLIIRCWGNQSLLSVEEIRNAKPRFFKLFTHLTRPALALLRMGGGMIIV